MSIVVTANLRDHTTWTKTIDDVPADVALVAIDVPTIATSLNVSDRRKQRGAWFISRWDTDTGHVEIAKYADLEDAPAPTEQEEEGFDSDWEFEIGAIREEFESELESMRERCTYLETGLRAALREIKELRALLPQTGGLPAENSGARPASARKPCYYHGPWLCDCENR